jgi:hypothetical protein
MFPSSKLIEIGLTSLVNTKLEWLIQTLSHHPRDPDDSLSLMILQFRTVIGFVDLFPPFVVPQSEKFLILVPHYKKAPGDNQCNITENKTGNGTEKFIWHSSARI